MAVAGPSSSSSSAAARVPREGVACRIQDGTFSYRPAVAPELEHLETGERARGRAKPYFRKV
jgi:hypothetical protein